jgi:thiamine pyrophosphate-dependent acetolactate synthase large subunit-like protein
MGTENPWADLPDTTDFVTVAQGFGVPGERVERPEDLTAAIQRALDSETSYLLDVKTTAGLRIRRALEGIIPVVSDRTPKSGHLDAVLDGSWPN